MNNCLARIFSSRNSFNRRLEQTLQFTYQCNSSHFSTASDLKPRLFLPKLKISKSLYKEFIPSLSNVSFSCNYCSSQNENQKNLKLGKDVDEKVQPVSNNGEIVHDKEEDRVNIRESIASRYKPFEDRQRVVQDVFEEEFHPLYQDEIEAPKVAKLKRGKTGVFDLSELCDLLTEEKATDLCVIRIPKEVDYAEHMVIVTARSPRQMYALATFIRKKFKSKELKSTDRLPRIEGSEKSDDWIALDLGNIILHIFMQETRDLMSLEILWTVGSQFDDLTHEKDSEIVQLLNLFQ